MAARSAGNGRAARTLLDAAMGHSRYAPGPLLRSWLHCVHSEVSARTGAPAQSVRHARHAEDSLSTRGEDPEWLDFFDSARLASFSATASSSQAGLPMRW